MILLRREVEHTTAVNEAYQKELEKLQKKNENVNLTLDTCYHQSKSIDKIWNAQIHSKVKSGMGYNTVPPPLRGVPSPPGIDLAHTGLEDFKDLEREYGPLKETCVKDEELVKHETDVFESASDSSVVDETVKKNVETSIPKVVNTVTEEPRKQANKPRSTVRYAEMYRNKPTAPRGN